MGVIMKITILFMCLLSSTFFTISYAVSPVCSVSKSESPPNVTVDKNLSNCTLSGTEISIKEEIVLSRVTINAEYLIVGAGVAFDNCTINSTDILFNAGNSGIKILNSTVKAESVYFNPSNNKGSPFKYLFTNTSFEGTSTNVDEDFFKLYPADSTKFVHWGSSQIPKQSTARLIKELLYSPCNRHA